MAKGIKEVFPINVDVPQARMFLRAIRREKREGWGDEMAIVKQLEDKVCAYLLKHDPAFEDYR